MAAELDPEALIVQSRRLIDAVGLIVVVPVCVGLILVTALRWSLMESLTAFGYGPLVIGLWALWLLVAVASVVAYLLRRPRRLGSALPLIVCAATFAILVLAPTERVQAYVDFRRHRGERESVVSRVLSGELKADGGGLVALGRNEPVLSRGGNEVAVKHLGNATFVLFYAVRGTLDDYSGFLWTSPGADPRLYEDLGETGSSEVRKLDEQWYWVEHS